MTVMPLAQCLYCGRKRPTSDTPCPGCGNFETVTKTKAQDIPDRCHIGRTPLGELTLETFDNFASDMVRLRLREGRELVADIYLSRIDIYRGVEPGTSAMPFILDALTTALRDTHQEELIPRLRRETEAMRYRFVPDDPSNYRTYNAGGGITLARKTEWPGPTTPGFEERMSKAKGPPISGFHTRLYRALKGHPQGGE